MGGLGSPREHEALAGLAPLVSALWRMTLPPGGNLYSAPEYVALMDYVLAHYPNAGDKFGLTFPLGGALQSLGLRVNVPPSERVGALPSDAGALALHRALLAPSTRRVYLCPLDWADNPPPIEFGPSAMRLFGPDELQELFDAPRLLRAYPNSVGQWDQLARFHWLAVQETKPLDRSPGERAHPSLFQPMDRDFGAFDPHKGKFPEPVEEALFFVLLAPWEDWCESPEVNWRGFQVPWIYTADRDLFIRPAPPPDPATLTWLPVAYTNAYTGEEFDDEQPAHYRLADEASGLPAFVSQERWRDWQVAKASPLFSPPIVHFMVRAFLSEKIDEFMAHMTVIDAALGLHADYQDRASSTHPRLYPTERIATRIEALLRDPVAGARYRTLFGVRSEYVHGRPMATISSDDQVQARSLARRVVSTLVDIAAAGSGALDRDQYLMSLLGQPEEAKMTLEQAEQVAKLINEQNKLSLPYTAAKVLGGDYLLEFDQAGTVIACAEVKSVQWYQAEVCHVSVDPDHKRQGYASKLVTLAEDRAKELGARILQCTIRQGNDDSERLFTRMGFAQGPAFYNAKTKNNVAIWTKVLKPPK